MFFMVFFNEGWCFMISSSKICLEPVGFVKTEALGKEVRGKEVISRIFFREEYAETLEGVEEFSHLFVLFWLDRMSSEDRRVIKVRPRGRSDMPLLGIFATRTPHRPNPIGLTRVRLLKVEGNVITVQGLDAFDGTPVLDIKPFDSWDTTENFRVPEWWKKLEKERKNKKW
jgi:tRNA-Thr(GGU) m(6)t(6)A37 methyltransferase TsaA